MRIKTLEIDADSALDQMWRAFERTRTFRVEMSEQNPLGLPSPYWALNTNATFTFPKNEEAVGVSASSTYGWDYRNRMTALYASSSPTTLFGYDHTANRVFKGYNGATTTIPSKYYNIEIASYATSTATTTKSIFTPSGELVATVTTVGATSTRKYIHTDHLGGMNAGTDSNGDTVEVADTYPYGAPRISETYGAPKAQRQFAGTERDLQQNMDYMINRYYSYDRGQFLSEDPVHWEIGMSSDGRKAMLDPQLQNSYSYARNNPIANKDPDGRWYVQVGLDQAIKINGVQIIPGGGGIRFNGQGMVTYSSTGAGGGLLANLPIQFNSGDINVFNPSIETSPEVTFAGGPSVLTPVLRTT